MTSVIGNLYQLAVPLFFLHNPALVCGEGGKPQELALLHMAFTLVTLMSSAYNGWEVGMTAVARHLRLQLFMCFSYIKSILTVALGVKVGDTFCLVVVVVVVVVSSTPGLPQSFLCPPPPPNSSISM